MRGEGTLLAVVQNTQHPEKIDGPRRKGNHDRYRTSFGSGMRTNRFSKSLITSSLLAGK